MIAADGSTNGLIEGVSRGASQACVYILEFQKTQLQVYGRIPKYSSIEWMQHLSRGLISSALSAGMVYGVYFSTYNQIHDKIIGGMVATVATSVIKIPIANSMRVLQSGGYPHVLAAAGAIFKAQGMRGIYSGYGVSLIDDYFDMECRIRVYNYLRGLVAEKDMNHNLGLVIGGLSGMVAATLTTPFDTVRCHMAIASTHKGKVCAFQTARNMFQVGGLGVFLRGIGYRASSNAVRSALFGLFYEYLVTHNNRKNNIILD